MQAHTQEFLDSLDPKAAFEFLKEGNSHFADSQAYNQNLSQQIKDTAGGQHPFAAVLSCMDSRTSVELTFGRGIGEIFSIRIAGNVVNDDILGSLEFAVGAKHVKLIVVLGHTNCGAVQGAYDKVRSLPHLTPLLEKIEPAVERAAKGGKQPSVEEVAEANVLLGIEEIVKRSDVVRNALEKREIGIVGGIYNTATGRVNFIEEKF